VIVPSDSPRSSGAGAKLGETLEPRNLRSSGGGEESFFSRMRRAFG
jgi:hypothetical protein